MLALEQQADSFRSANEKTNEGFQQKEIACNRNSLIPQSIYLSKRDGPSTEGFIDSLFTKLPSAISKEQGGNVEGLKKVKSNSKWGVIPYRTNSSGKIEVLVISTKRKNWSLPKGNLMKRIGPARTAQLEAYEEAGIEGALASKPIPCSIGRTCIYLYPMAVSKVFENWPEASFRKRKWIELSKACHILHHRAMGKVLRKFFPQRT